MNPVTNTVYATDISNNNLTIISPSIAQPSFLNTAITALPGDRAASPTPSFTLTATSTFAPTAPAVQAIYYQMDTQSGAWTLAGSGASATFNTPALSGGLHTLFAYASDGQDATSTNTGLHSSPLPGAIAAYTFVVQNTAAVNLTGLSLTYTGAPQGATVTTVPPGVATSVTYNGLGTVPTNAGSYAVVATITAPGFVASSASGTLVIAKAAQTITFAALPNVPIGTPPITLSATASAGPVSFTLSSGPATLAGSVLTITGLGSVTVQATQAGNSNYNAAAPVNQTFMVTLTTQTITFGALPNVTFGAAPITLSATASSGLAVSFTLVSGPATLAGNVLTITGAGSVTVQATQAGNGAFGAATPVNQTFTVLPATLAFSSPPFATPTPTIIGQTVQFSATTNPTGAVQTFTWNFTDGATATGSSVSHAFATYGTFNVSLTVTDTTGQSITATVVVSVPVVDPIADANKDGYANEVALALGSNPFTAGATPLGLPPVTASGTLTVKRLRIKLNFFQNNTDQIQIMGSIPGLTTIPAGSTLVLDVGHVVNAFTFNAKGKAIGSAGLNGAPERQLPDPQEPGRGDVHRESAARLVPERADLRPRSGGAVDQHAGCVQNADAERHGVFQHDGV